MTRIYFRQIKSPRRAQLLLDLGGIARKEVKKTFKNKLKPPLIKAHNKVVKDWKSDVFFKSMSVVRPDYIALFIFPAGKDKAIYGFVDLGTKPHTITAKNAPLLAFRWGGKGSYVPKTLPKPARTVSGGGYVTTPNSMRYTRSVNHPGNKAREFSKTIGKDSKPFIVKELENAFRRIARKTGYA